MKSCSESRKAPRATTTGSLFSSENSRSLENGGRAKYRSRTHSYSQSSEEDSHRRSSFIPTNCGKSAHSGSGNNKGSHSFSANTVANRSPASACTTNVVGNSPCENNSINCVSSSGNSSNNINGNCSSHSNSHNVSNSNGSSITTTSVTSANSNVNNNGSGGSNVTVVGVVRPHQRKPPSPQIFHRTVRSRASSSNLHDLSPASANDECYAFVQQQRSLRLTAPEPQCDLSVSHSENDGILNGVSRNLLTDHYQQQRMSSKVSGLKSTEKSTSQGSKVGGKAGRKPKSPALASSSESPVRKKRGRKRAIKVPDLTDSEEEGSKVNWKSSSLFILSVNVHAFKGMSERTYVCTRVYYPYCKLWTVMV